MTSGPSVTSVPGPGSPGYKAHHTHGALNDMSDLILAGASHFITQANQNINRLVEAPDPTTSTITQKLMQQDADDAKMLTDIGDELKQHLADLDKLEEGIPDRESIKKRFKTQTSLGLAQAFFNAAGKGSPDFMTSMASAFGDASGVMNKMTGAEQNALYKHAIDEYGRKASRANAAFKRRNDLMAEIRQRSTTTAQLKANRLKAAEIINTEYDRRIKNNIEAYKAVVSSTNDASRIAEASATLQRQVEDDFNDNVRAWAQDPSTGVTANVEQWERYVGSNNAYMGTQGGRRAVNEGLKAVMKELNAIKKQKMKDNVANPLEAAYDELMGVLIDSDNTRIGDRTILNRFGGEISQALEQSKTPADAMKILQNKYPWLDI